MKTISLKKKVAAVAVASLGLGLLSVVPAQAAATANTGQLWAGDSATVAANHSTTVNSAVGVANTLTLKSISTAGAAGNMDITFTAVLPANFGGVTTNAITTGSWGTFVANNANSTCSTPSAAVMRSAAGAAGSHGCTGTFTYTPNVPGVYVLTATLGGDEGGTVAANSSITHVWTIYAGYDAGGSVNVRRAYPAQGANITTGWTATAGGQATLRLTNMAASTTYFVTTNNGAILSGTGSDAGGRVPVAATVTLTNGTNLSGGFNFATSAGVTSSDTMDIRITDSGSPASTTVKVVSYNALTGASTTFVEATVTWGVAAVPSAQYSLLTLNAGAGTTATGAASDTTSTTVANTAGTKQFTIQVVVRDQYNVAFNGLVLGASITGPGTLGIATSVNSSATSSGRSVTVSITDNDGEVTVFGDGTSGKSTITVTATTAAGTVVLGTKTVTFAGSPATATVTQNLYVAQAGAQLGATAAASTPAATSVATTAALRATIKDANNVNVTSGRTVRIVSSDSTVIVAGACAELTTDGDIDVAGNQATPGVFECTVSGATGAASGKSATITFEVLNATTGLYDIKATPITFKIGGAIAAVAVSFDKATYTPGAAMNLTATATDSAGNAAYDGQAPYASIAGNMAVGGSLPATTKQIVNGKLSTTGAAATLFAPANSGTYTVSGLTIGTATDPAGKAWSASATIAGSAEIASIQTQMTALVAAIAKLQKAINKINKRLNR